MSSLILRGIRRDFFSLELELDPGRATTLQIILGVRAEVELLKQ
jgi:hypothetical protein